VFELKIKIYEEIINVYLFLLTMNGRIQKWDEYRVGWEMKSEMIFSICLIGR
jgi:hypothetical protein